MVYNIKYSDPDKSAITVYDKSPENTSTSLTFPGRNSTDYGVVVATNFLHLLENFASSAEPSNPIEGQLWYDNANGYLKIWDNVSWQAASNITKSLTAPNPSESNVGELWIDLTNQQLNIFNGVGWVLVGPSLSSKDGKKYGSIVEEVKDTDGITRSILTEYIADIPVLIISKDTFTPNPIIMGFGQIVSGINFNSDSDLTKFDGGFKPKLSGTASTASALAINGFDVPANNFLRSDVISSTDYQLNIRNNSGISIGTESDFKVFYTTESAKLYNSVYRSGIDLQVKNSNGVIKTVLRIKGDETGERVGINTLAPTQALDVTGNILASGTLTVGSNSDSSIKTTGGLDSSSVKTTTLTVSGLLSFSNDLLPTVNESSTIGRKATNTGISQLRLKAMHVKSVYADELLNADGTVFGLSFAKNITVDDTLTVGGLTTVSSSIIPNKITDSVDLGTTAKRWGSVYSSKVYSSGITIDNNLIPTATEQSNIGTSAIRYDSIYVKSIYTDSVKNSAGTSKLTTSTGTIIQFAGSSIPDGYLACDGSEKSRTTYSELYAVIGETYKRELPYSGADLFRVPLISNTNPFNSIKSLIKA